MSAELQVVELPEEVVVHDTMHGMAWHGMEWYLLQEKYIRPECTGR